MNIIATVFVTIASFLIVFGYEFSILQINKQDSSDFAFKDFYLYQTNKNGVQLLVRSKEGSKKGDDFELLQTSVARKKQPSGDIESLTANNLTFRDQVLSLHDEVSFTSGDFLIHSQFLEYDLKEDKITANQAITKLGENYIQSTHLSFDTAAQKLDAQDVESILYLDSDFLQAKQSI